MTFTSLDEALWLAGFVGHVAVLVVLLVRGRTREFPVFASLVAYQIAVTIALFLISRYGTEHQYYLGYWVLAPGDYAFQIALIFEIARIVLRPTGTWVRDARLSFLLWSAVGVLVSAGLSLEIHPPATKGLDLWEVRATVFTSLLTCEMFLAMSTAAHRVGLLWRSHVMALGNGLTVWALIQLFGDIVHLALGWRLDFVVFDYVRMFVYVAVLGYWSVVFWLPERERVPLSPEMQDYLIALNRKVEYDLHRLGKP
jgi:hypothetical protein